MKTWAFMDGASVTEIVTLPDNFVPGDTIFDPAGTYVDVTGVAGITVGSVKGAGGTWSAPPPAAPAIIVPQIIERRQFFQQLAIQSVITNVEALAALATGTIPAALMALVTGLPADEQFAAQMLIIGAPTFNRADPLTLDLGAAKGWTPAQIDALWTAAAAL